MIRKATEEDASRIAEILVFVKRMKYRPIFKDDAYAFVEMQVLPIAKKYVEDGIIDNMFVYDDGIVKGLIHIEGNEIVITDKGKKMLQNESFKRQAITDQLESPNKPSHDSQQIRRRH